MVFFVYGLLRLLLVCVMELREQRKQNLHSSILVAPSFLPISPIMRVLNHGIAEGTLGQIKKVALEFFRLPLEEKEKYPMKTGTIQGYGHGFMFSKDQKLDWCDMMALGTMPKVIRKENLWPTIPPYFRDTLEAYSREVLKLCRTLLRLIAENLHLKPEIFNDMFGENVQAVCMNYYPPCSRPDLVLGLSAHSDGSALTVLLQDDESIGLQIFNNRWISVEPIPNALVINIGDTLQVSKTSEEDKLGDCIGGQCHQDYSSAPCLAVGGLQSPDTAMINVYA